MKILVADNLHEDGIDILKQHADVDVNTGLTEAELVEIIGGYEALMVRSQTQVTAKVIKAGKKLQVIARAGVGLDNVDIEEATKHGIVVANAPTGNIISAAEHAVALMLALARNVPQANASLKAGKWLRKDFMGTEIRHKTLGVVGLGNVGSEVARRCRGLDMDIIAYDPFISVDHAQNLKVRLVKLDDLLKEADFISMHLPLTDSTVGIIGKKELDLVKRSVRIINCARGGLIDDKALLDALKGGKVAGAAIDVFAKEPTTSSPLFELDNVIVTPHLGASTTEAQALVAKDAACQITAVLNGEPALYAVNAPFVPPEMHKALLPFGNLASSMGKLLSQLGEGQLNSIQIKYEGEVSQCETNVLKASLLSGLMEQISEERVNLINANVIANRRGISVVEEKQASCQNYPSLITAEVTTSTGSIIVAGTVLREESHIVMVNRYWLDVVPTGGYFLFSDHLDRPGLISAVSKVTGDADVDISAMHVGRLKPRGEALMVLALDEPLSEEHLKQILAIPDVYSAKLVRL